MYKFKPVAQLFEALSFLLYGVVVFFAKSSMLVTLDSVVKDSDFPSKNFESPFLIGNCAINSERSYEAGHEFDEDASSVVSHEDENHSDSFESIESSPMDDVDES